MNDIVTRDNLRPLVNHLTSNLTERNADLLAELKVMERELGKIASAIDNLLDQLEETPRTDAEPIRKRLAKREEDRRNCERCAGELRRALTATADIPKIADDTLNTYIQKVHVALQSEDVALPRVILKEKTGTIYYSFPFQELSRIQSIPRSISKVNQSSPRCRFSPTSITSSYSPN
jgi:GTP:adenosylcobinamide-phosphate guanylyltransferase